MFFLVLNLFFHFLMLSTERGQLWAQWAHRVNSKVWPSNGQDVLLKGSPFRQRFIELLEVNPTHDL